MKTLGFVGTAKNTGKTTTALHMLDLVSAAGIKTALTSIGYDGENTDHVTGLPKPRYIAESGMVIATASRLLELGTAEYSHIQSSGLKTILGEILIAEVSRPGYVVLAGPNRRVDLHKLLKQLQAMGVELTIADGALNRLAAMVLADGMVLSTGASFDERIDPLTDHAAAMESLFHYPVYSGLPSDDPKVVCFYEKNSNATRRLAYGSVMEPASMLETAAWFTGSPAGTLFVPGVYQPLLFQELVGQYSHCLGGVDFVFSSPLNLLASGNPEIWQASFSCLTELGSKISYLSPIPLHFMTVNPFYPKYLQKTGNYIAEFVDKHELLSKARMKVKKTPVVDILQPPHPDLLAQCGIQTFKSGGIS